MATQKDNNSSESARYAEPVEGEQNNSDISLPSEESDPPSLMATKGPNLKEQPTEQQPFKSPQIH